MLISLTILPRKSNADQLIPIKKGEVAAFDGALADVERLNTIKSGLQERDLYKQITESQQKSIDLLKQNDSYSETKVTMLLKQNDDLEKSLQSSQSMNSWEKIGLVTLGVLMTVGAGVAARNLLK